MQTQETLAVQPEPAFVATDLILDLETLGNGPSAAIVSIGATLLDRKSRTFGPTFHVHVDVEDVVRCGGVMDPSTVVWWLDQSDEARKALLEGQKQAITTGAALVRFADFIGVADDGVHDRLKVWGNGSTFDCTILRSAFTNYGLVCPWHYWNERDLRTAMDLAGLKKKDVPTPEGFVAHHAGWDALYQTHQLVAVLDALSPQQALSLDQHPDGADPRVLAAAAAPVVDKDTVRAVLLRHGFTIKQGHDDLKPYVFDAVAELMELARKPTVGSEGDTNTVCR